MLATTLFLATLLPFPPMPWGGQDFVQYYVAAELARAGHNPYDHKLAQAAQLHYHRPSGVETYAPPWAILPAFPLTFLPFEQALYVNIALNLLLLVASVAAWTRMLFPEQPRFVLPILASLPLWMPALAVIGIGQNSLWPFAAFTGWLWFTKKQQPIPAALCLVLTVIKPHLGLLPGLFVAARWLRHKQWRAIIAFTLALLALTALTLWLRPTIWADYLQAIRTGTPPTQIRTATLDGWGRIQFGHSFQYVSWTLWGCALFIAVVFGWKCVCFSHNATESSSSLTHHSLLANRCVIVSAMAIAFVPYAFSFDFVFLLPGFILAIGRALQGARLYRWTLATFLALELWMVWGKLAPWEEAAYWFIPLLGLATTIWLVSLHSRPLVRTPAG